MKFQLFLKWRCVVIRLDDSVSLFLGICLHAQCKIHTCTRWPFISDYFNEICQNILTTSSSKTLALSENRLREGARRTYSKLSITGATCVLWNVWLRPIASITLIVCCEEDISIGSVHSHNSDSDTQKESGDDSIPRGPYELGYTCATEVTTIMQGYKAERGHTNQPFLVVLHVLLVILVALKKCTTYNKVVDITSIMLS